MGGARRDEDNSVDYGRLITTALIKLPSIALS
jgi:hypothetical protein